MLQFRHPLCRHERLRQIVIPTSITRQKFSFDETTCFHSVHFFVGFTTPIDDKECIVVFV